MQFDARAAKLLSPGSHLTIDEYPGLRLKATESRRTWIYRYKSPVDSRMRQIKIGTWPAMSLVAAVSHWETLKAERDAGGDPGVKKRATRQEAVAIAERDRKELKEAGYSVRLACDAYWTGHVERHRAKKGSLEIKRMFRTMLGPLAERPAAQVTRSEAFALLESYSDIPVQAAKLRAELGAAWDYNLDAGKFPETTPNWWRQIMRGRLRSKGKKIDGVSAGTIKRSLSEVELGQLLRWIPNFRAAVPDVLTLYLWTCTRGSEIVSMHAAEVTEEDDGLWWTIPKKKTKNARHENATDLRVPLVGRAADVVRRRLAENPGGYLFSNDTDLGHLQQKYIQETVFYYQPYCKIKQNEVRSRLPVSHWSPHDLRRTARTLLASMECPDPVAEAVLGHMQPGVKGTYNRHSYDRERKLWLTRLDTRLEEIVAGT
jgi:integrase